MGVPGLFMWLRKKCPSMIVDCEEEKAKHVDGKRIPVNTTQRNPNGVEFDNLYLDMNEIIVPCCYPSNKPAPQNDDEIMCEIFLNIDRLVSIVRPRKLLYIAFDGVAPRAKMKKMRSSRFIGSKIRRENREAQDKKRSEIEDSGRHLPPKRKETYPGKGFMFRQAEYFRYYVTERLNNDPGWQGIKVILSDANTPGEGEHKIMDYIRKQRANPDYNPSTHHCVHGADSLATHEMNFTIIREQFKPNQRRACELCYQEDHEMTDCQGLDAPPEERENEYLVNELLEGIHFHCNHERVIDDWVFLCFFVGNDFLPHLPSLNIREGAIDILIRLYRKALHNTKDYLTENGVVNLKLVQQLMTDLGKEEDETFKKWRVDELKNEETKIMPAVSLFVTYSIKLCRVLLLLSLHSFRKSFNPADAEEVDTNDTVSLLLVDHQHGDARMPSRDNANKVCNTSI
eukprot:XP_011661921.1 PREDICTED: 5'-3' exoribonuclease 2-like [Strongylocentrotus purpuratus]